MMNPGVLLWIERVFLALCGVIFVVSGVFTLFQPHMMGTALGIAPVDASGVTEIRATYGGLVIGSGILMLLGLFDKIFAVSALAGVVLGAGGLMSTRIVVQSLEGFTVNQIVVATFELSMVVGAFLLMRAAYRRAGGTRFWS